MARKKTILIVGTYDTKDEELKFLAECIRNQGGHFVSMDVSVLGEPSSRTTYSKHDVAKAAGSSIAAVIESGDENTAMQIMADGAAALTVKLYGQKKFDGVIILGGSMGTDLALDVTASLPLGVPKYIVSTISFSPLIPPHRLAADIQMILWAGGLYGLNSVCRASLSQAAGAVLGAAQSVTEPSDKPLIGMTSLGTSALRYAIPLKPALEARGFELAVFHATGMGGRAFESLAGSGAFVCVLDFCTQELGNHIHGSNISAGEDRLTSAGKSGTPQIVAPGFYDVVDVIGWQPVAEKWKDRVAHNHNRLIKSISLDINERRESAKAHAKQLSKATGPTAFILPTHGCGEWDKPGEELHDPEGLAAFCDEFRRTCPENVELYDMDCHINDQPFADEALAIIDSWIEADIIDGGVSTPKKRAVPRFFAR